MFFSVTTTQAEVLDCEPTPPKPPAPSVSKKPDPPGGCDKHARCHCNLFSIDEQDFFTIKV